MTDINIKKERRRGMRRMLFIMLICGFLACDVNICDRTVYRSPLGQLADYLREQREKESRQQLEAGKRNYERIYREQRETERRTADRAGEP
jgi:hypothetical protein